jgi:very-short-patch-repair endonuclease
MENSLNKGTREINFENAKRMRKGPTHEEYVMWEELRNRKLLGYKFRRQHPLNNYIADFYCHELKLVIELDGKYHEQEEVKDKDQKRTDDLQALGINVYRISNEDLKNRSLTIEKLLHFIQTLPPPSL